MPQDSAIPCRPAADRLGAPHSRRSVRHFGLAGLLLGLALVPTLALSKDANEGYVTIYTRSGGIIQKQITDQAMLDTLSKDAMVIPDGGAIMMHGGKWYFVTNHKMPDGTMMLDMMMKK